VPSSRATSSAAPIATTSSGFGIVLGSRPVTCPMLDPDSASCLVYQARPVACRAYGFYAEREFVLGCSRIESVSRQASDVVWGNHTALEQRMDGLGEAAELSQWLARSP